MVSTGRDPTGQVRLDSEDHHCSYFAATTTAATVYATVSVVLGLTKFVVAHVLGNLGYVNIYCLDCPSFWQIIKVLITTYSNTYSNKI